MIAPLTCIVAICLLPCAEGTMRSSQAAQRPVNGHAKASANSGNPHLPTRPGGSQSTGTPADKSRRLKGASAQGSTTSAAAAQRRKTPARPRKPSPPKSNAKGAASAQHEKPEGGCSREDGCQCSPRQHWGAAGRECTAHQHEHPPAAGPDHGLLLLCRAWVPAAPNAGEAAASQLVTAAEARQTSIAGGQPS